MAAATVSYYKQSSDIVRDQNDPSLIESSTCLQQQQPSRVSNEIASAKVNDLKHRIEATAGHSKQPTVKAFPEAIDLDEVAESLTSRLDLSALYSDQPDYLESIRSRLRPLYVNARALQDSRIAEQSKNSVSVSSGNSNTVLQSSTDSVGQFGGVIATVRRVQRSNVESMRTPKNPIPTGYMNRAFQSLSCRTVQSAPSSSDCCRQRLQRVVDTNLSDKGSRLLGRTPSPGGDPATRQTAAFSCGSGSIHAGSNRTNTSGDGRQQTGRVVEPVETNRRDDFTSSHKRIGRRADLVVVVGEQIRCVDEESASSLKHSNQHHVQQQQQHVASDHSLLSAVSSFGYSLSSFGDHDLGLPQTRHQSVSLTDSNYEAEHGLSSTTTKGGGDVRRGDSCVGGSSLLGDILEYCEEQLPRIPEDALVDACRLFEFNDLQQQQQQQQQKTTQHRFSGGNCIRQKQQQQQQSNVESGLYNFLLEQIDSDDHVSTRFSSEFSSATCNAEKPIPVPSVGHVISRSCGGYRGRAPLQENSNLGYRTTKIAFSETLSSWNCENMELPKPETCHSDLLEFIDRTHSVHDKSQKSSAAGGELRAEGDVQSGTKKSRPCKLVRATDSDGTPVYDLQLPSLLNKQFNSPSPVAKYYPRHAF